MHFIQWILNTQNASLDFLTVDIVVDKFDGIVFDYQVGKSEWVAMTDQYISTHLHKWIQNHGFLK